MDYNRVALFVRVVQAGSFTAAAAAVRLPKSSVSRSVSQLEAELGVRLMHRTTRKLALTDAGHAYYESVKDSVAALEQAEAATREGGPAPRGTVRMTAAPAFVALAPLLAQFMRKYPGIRIELTLTSRYVDLVTEGIDLAVRAGRLPDSTLVARRIGSTQLILMASPAYLRRRGRPRSVADLAAHDWVLYRAPGGKMSMKLTGPGGEHAVEVEGALVADEMVFCRAAAEAGCGIALLPVYGAQEALIAGRLEQVLPGWTYGDAALSVVLPTGRQVPSRVALLRDFLVVEIGKQFAEFRQRCDGPRPARARQTQVQARE